MPEEEDPIVQWNLTGNITATNEEFGEMQASTRSVERRRPNFIQRMICPWHRRNREHQS